VVKWLVKWLVSGGERSSTCCKDFGDFNSQFHGIVLNFSTEIEISRPAICNRGKGANRAGFGTAEQ